MRSSAFDASEKPAVGGKLTASKIAVIGEGLAAKLKPPPLPLERGTDFNTRPDAEEITRFVLYGTTYIVAFLAAGDSTELPRCRGHIF